MQNSNMVFETEDGRRWQIEFAYEQLIDIYNNPLGTLTECFLSEIDENFDKLNLYSSHARQNPKDTFNKETGRKIALARVLQGMQWSYENRRRAWYAYMNRGGKIHYRKASA